MLDKPQHSFSTDGRVRWTDAQIEEVKGYHAQKLSYSFIGDKFGVTKGAIAGLIKRLGLATSEREMRLRRREKAEQQAVEREIKRQARERAHKPNWNIQRPKRQSHFNTDGIRDLPPEVSPIAVSFFELKDTHCRWPLGDPRDIAEMKFCGGLPLKDKPYCMKHCLCAYAPQESTTRKAAETKDKTHWRSP